MKRSVPESFLERTDFFMEGYLSGERLPTFILLNKKILISTFPVPHTRTMAKTVDTLTRDNNSNYAFVIREPERLSYYLNRFNFIWRRLERNHCQDLCKGIHDKITNKTDLENVILFFNKIKWPIKIDYISTNTNISLTNLPGILEILIKCSIIRKCSRDYYVATNRMPNFFREYSKFLTAQHS